jgi:anti-sigma B factor antagonist
MEVCFSPTRRVAVVAPSGELDLVSVDQLRRALLQACEAERLVVVDLAAVTFMDSAGLGVLVGAAKRLQHRGAALQILNATGEPLRVIQLTGLDMLLAGSS